MNMEFIMAPAIVGIIALGFFKIIELFVRKKERIMIIEKLSDLSNININSSLDLGKILTPQSTGGKYVSLRLGMLVIGLGIGMIIGYFILPTNLSYALSSVGNDASWRLRDIAQMLIGASSLVFGGIGFVSAFIIEHMMRKKE